MMIKFPTPATRESPYASEQQSDAASRSNIRVMLATMQQQLDELVQMIHQREKKQHFAEAQISTLNILYSKQKDTAQRQIIQQNEIMIKILEKKKLQIQNLESIKKNEHQWKNIEREKQKLDMKQKNIQFQKLKLDQIKKQLQWKESEDKRKQNTKVNKMRLIAEIENMKNNIRTQMGISEDSSIHLNQSSLFQELTYMHFSKNCIAKQIKTIGQVKIQNVKVGKNVPSIEEVKEMSLLSPLGLVLDIKDSRRYPFQQPSSLSLMNPQ